MKQFLLNIVSSFLSIVLFIIAVFLLAYFFWWNKPLGEPMHIETVLNSDYTGYWKWFWWAAGAGFMYLTAIVVLLIAILKKK
jgi:hypothetical protein